MPLAKEQQKTKVKTKIFGSKLFIVVSLAGFFLFFAVIITGSFFFRDVLPKNTNSVRLVELKDSSDPLVTIVSYKPVRLISDPIKENGGSTLDIFEFGDYECPYTALSESAVKEVLQAYPGKVRLVWKDYPSATHPQGVNAAIVGRCAQLQGKFWEMHDLLLENNNSLSPARYQSFAEKLGLDMATFNECLDSSSTAALVQQGVNLGEGLKIDATPHFYVGNQEIYGQADFEDFKKLIDLELES